MSSKHTPGPWISDGERVLTTTGRDRKVADIGAPGTEYRDDGGDHTDAIDHYFEVVHANAAIIAAAPDLLAACEAVAEDVCSSLCPSKWRTDSGQPHSAQCGQLRAAIKKARGE